MNPSKVLAVGAAALLGFTSAADADVTVRITGSTAFRASTIAAVETLLGGAGNFKAAYQSSGTITNTGAANNAIFQGTIASVPAAGVVTVKCAWSGSTGGIKTMVQNIPVTTWMTDASLPGTNTTVGIPSPTFDAGTIADVTMEDSAQASTGFTTSTLTEQKVGVIAFEWVVGNTNAPAAFDNITPLLAQAVISGGAPLSQFTGNPADTAQVVYMLGRNFDSGTRLSALAETGVGVFGGVQHIQATTTGGSGAGTNGSSINRMKLYPAESVLSQPFAIGQSGYSSGGTIADILATPGALTAATAADGTNILPAEELQFGAGHLISYLGRGDASRACRTSNIASNTARRLKVNGFQIWNGTTFNPNGTPVAGYNDALITEGLYQMWEFELLAYRQNYGTTSPQGKAVADAIANRIRTVDVTLSGTKLSDMHVSKAVEGGIITYGAPQ
jgi:hypothetical protein